MLDDEDEDEDDAVFGAVEKYVNVWDVADDALLAELFIRLRVTLYAKDDDACLDMIDFI